MGVLALKVTLVISGVMMCGFLFAAIWLPEFIHNKINQEMNAELVVTSKDSQGYASWLTEKTDQVTLYRTCYIQNLTNPHEVYRGAKPIIAEVGPFSYIETRLRYNVSFTDDLSRARFRMQQLYFFDKNTSCATCDPNITITAVSATIAGLIAGVEAVAGTGFWGRLAASIASAPEQIFVPLTADQIINGYTDPVLELVALVQPGTSTGFPGLGPNLTSETDAPGQTVIGTGFPNPDQTLSWLYEFKGQKNLGIWNNSKTNTFYGSYDGTQFVRNLDRAIPQPVYVDSLYMSVNVLWVGDIKVHGLRLSRFSLDNNTFLNASLVPEHAGEYMFGPSGVDNLTMANQGAPIFMSKPHFLDADPIYVENIIGMQPNRSIHDTTVDVEIQTGATMQASQRIQLNVEISPILIYGQRMRPTLVPIAWVEETSVISPELAGDFRNTVYRFKDVAKYGRWVLAALSAIFFMLSIFVFVRLRKQLKKHHAAYEMTEDDAYHDIDRYSRNSGKNTDRAAASFRQNNINDINDIDYKKNSNKSKIGDNNENSKNNNGDDDDDELVFARRSAPRK